jgi:hypothetical protein
MSEESIESVASQLVMNGADLTMVRDLLGHKSMTMTLRYAHLAPRKKHEAIGLIDRAFGVDNSPSGDTPSDTVRVLEFRRKA